MLRGFLKCGFAFRVLAKVFEPRMSPITMLLWLLLHVGVYSSSPLYTSVTVLTSLKFTKTLYNCCCSQYGHVGHHLSNGDCLEHKMEDYQSCCMLYCVTYIMFNWTLNSTRVRGL